MHGIRKINFMNTTTWFRRIGWIYFPSHTMGAIVTLAAIAFLVPVYTAILRTGHSVSDDMYNLFVYTSCTAFWWKWVAEKTSKS
jgi:hypothetical protein